MKSTCGADFGNGAFFHGLVANFCYVFGGFAVILSKKRRHFNSNALNQFSKHSREVQVDWRQFLTFSTL